MTKQPHGLNTAIPQLRTLKINSFMRKIFFIVMAFVHGIVSCQSHRESCYIIIEDADGVEILHASGTLCNDTVFYIDNEYIEIVENTTGLEFGRVFLHNEKGVVIGELPIVGFHEQNLSVILGPKINCFLDGRLACKQGYFVFPKAKVNNVEKIKVP